MVKEFYISAAAIVVADQLTKWLVADTIPRGGFLPILGSQIGLTSLRNTGVAFGMLQGSNAILIVVGIVVSLALIIWGKRLAPWKGGPVLCGLLLGGIIGNIIDRIIYGSVFDFIQVGPWPAFNIADSALTLGVLALIYESIKN